MRFSVADQDYHFVNPSPTGERSDPSAFAQLPRQHQSRSPAPTATRVTGRAILDYGGTYPSTFDSSVTRRLLYGETVVHVTPAFDLAGGVRVENEHGTSGDDVRDRRATTPARSSKRAARSRGHLYVNGGLGFDHNDVFGNAWTPRVSVAAYLRQPSATRGARRHEADVQRRQGHQGAEPRPGAVVAVRADAAGDARRRSGIQPIGPERSRSVDVGVEQGLARRPRPRSRRLLRQRVPRSHRVRQQERAAAARRPGRRGRRVGLRRLRELAVEHARAASRCRAKRSWARSKVIGVVHVSRRDRDGVVQQRRAQPGGQPGVSRHPDRAVLAARRRSAIPAAGELRQPRRLLHRSQGAGRRWPATSSASATTARS